MAKGENFFYYIESSIASWWHVLGWLENEHPSTKLESPIRGRLYPGDVVLASDSGVSGPSISLGGEGTRRKRVIENTKIKISKPSKPSSTMLARNMLAPSIDH